MRTKKDVPLKTKRTMVARRAILKEMSGDTLSPALVEAVVQESMAREVASHGVKPHVIDSYGGEAAVRVKPTKAEVRAEAARVAKATAFKVLPHKVIHVTIERARQARFAARQLVEGKAVMLSDDSVRAMAEFIYHIHTAPMILSSGYFGGGL